MDKYVNKTIVVSNKSIYENRWWAIFGPWAVFCFLLSKADDNGSDFNSSLIVSFSTNKKNQENESFTF